jgi:hypothetical protein
MILQRDWREMRIKTRKFEEVKNFPDDLNLDSKAA